MKRFVSIIKQLVGPKSVAAWLCAFGLGCEPSASWTTLETGGTIADPSDIVDRPVRFELNRFARMPRVDRQRSEDAIQRTASAEDLPRWADVIHALRLRNTMEHGQLSADSQELLGYVLNSNLAHSRFGEAIHFVSRHGVSILSWDPSLRKQGEPHPDKTVCVVGQLGLERDRPLKVQGAEFRVGDLVGAAMSNFSWEQENAFTVVAMLHYLPGKRGWHNKHGEVITFDAVAQKLCEDIQGQVGSCFCTHNLFALAMLLRADDRSPILSPNTRRVATERVHRSLHQFLDCFRRGDPREPDFTPVIGSRALNPNPTDKYIRVTSVVVTSHYLEVLAFAPDDLLAGLDAEQATRDGLEFLLRQIELAPSDMIVESFGPYSHAANALALFDVSEPAAAQDAANQVAAGPGS